MLRVGLSKMLYILLDVFQCLFHSIEVWLLTVSCCSGSCLKTQATDVGAKCWLPRLKCINTMIHQTSWLLLLWVECLLTAIDTWLFLTTLSWSRANLRYTCTQLNILMNSICSRFSKPHYKVSETWVVKYRVYFYKMQNSFAIPSISTMCLRYWI